MPIIEPAPINQLADGPRGIIEGGMRDGLYATPIPLQIFAYSTRQLEAIHAKRTADRSNSLIDGRIMELIRIRSAQLGECQPCMQSRKHDSITDEDVACLLDADHLDLSPQERMAVRFLDLLSADHHAIDASFYAEMAEVFSTGQIIELGFACAETMGVHRFIHTLDTFGSEEPTLRFSTDQVDTKHEAGSREPSGV